MNTHARTHTHTNTLTLIPLQLVNTKVENIGRGSLVFWGHTSRVAPLGRQK